MANEPIFDVVFAGELASPARRTRSSCGSVSRPSIAAAAKYCVNCHGSKISEGKLRGDSLNPDMLEGPDADRWHEVLNRLNVGEMPPEDEPQPTRKEREILTLWLTRSLDAAAEAKRASDGRIVFRRLNRREYNNTLNDLFHINLDITKLLPPERPSADGFRNNGQDLVMSPLHFEYFLKIARLYLDKAVVNGPQPLRQGFRTEFKADKKGGPQLIAASFTSSATRRHSRTCSSRCSNAWTFPWRNSRTAHRQ
ncbi:MAG: hypothetical protein CMJ78_17910 [Planctomycetaceae bacterium]|nr:hypothetical protein [Planctomycetaceae bacterium]